MSSLNDVLAGKAEIERRMKEVDNRIENNEDGSMINKSFDDLKKSLEDIEDEEELHGFFKHIYHTKLSCYLASIGKSSEASKNLEVAKRYEKYITNVQSAPQSASQSAPQSAHQSAPPSDELGAAEDESFVTFGDKNEIDEATFEQVRVDLDSFIRTASRISSDNDSVPSFKQEALELFKNQVESFIQFRPDNFDQYLILYSRKSTLETLFNEIDVSLTELADKSINVENVVSASVFLKEFLFQVAFVKIRIDFMSRALKSPEPVKLLFNIDLLDESINKQFKRLSLHFHPDKIADWLPSTRFTFANEFFVFISELRDKLLKNFSKSSLNELLASGHNLWKMAKDYKRMLKGEYDKLEVFRKADVLSWKDPDVRNLQDECLNNAYSQYKAACKLADLFKMAADQVKLRGYVSLVLYESGKDLLVSQLYALSALRLVVKHSNLLTEKDLSDAKKIYEKVSTGGSLAQTSQARTSVAAVSSLVRRDDALALIRLDDHTGSSNTLVSSKMSYESRQKLDNAISDHLNDAVAKLVVKSDRELVKYQANQEEILRTKAHGLRHRVAGVSLLSAGAVGGTVGAWALQAEIAAGTALALGPVAWIGFGLFFVGTGMFTGYKLVKKSNQILEEPTIRENLNAILKNALAFFDDKQQHGLFLKELAKEYTKGKRLLNLASLNKSINTELLISTLISHGFRPDGIAYLLNLIGEALISGRATLDNFSSDDLKNQAMRVFDATLDESLVAEADNLDKRIKELRLKNMGFLRRQFLIARSSVSDFYSSRNYTSIAREHLDDSKSMSFRFRLEEMRNIARLNKAIMRLLKSRDDEIKLAEEDIKSVRSSVDKNYQFIGKASLRLDAIEDFFWIITGKNVEAPLAIKPNSNVKQETQNTESYLQYLNERLRVAKSAAEKIELFIKKASYYEKKAIKNEKSANMIESLKDWKETIRNFEEALSIDKHYAVAGIGFARCLTKLSKYSKAVEYLEDSKRFLSDLPEFWLLLSIAYQKKAYYHNARHAITQALCDSKFVHDQTILKQKRILDRLEEKNLEKRLQVYQNVETQCEKIWYSKRTSSESPAYNILSIDGGGVRGIMPALWLYEVEKQTKRPISHLFNMMSGSSVGALIAGALSMPESKDRDIKTANPMSPVITQCYFSDFEPQYSAFEIFRMFNTESKQIFSDSKKGLLDYIFGTNLSVDKYTDTGRKGLFDKYFRGSMLSDSLNDLVVTAVSQNDMTNTYLFNRHDALKDQDKDDSLLDVVMASSAAPSFFPMYQIKNRGSFMDGGVHLNNPAMAAYGEALRYGVDKEKIFMLSLGTGSYMPDPFNPELCQGQLFWAQNFHTVALAAQECNVDKDMYRTLGVSYQRWQTSLDRAVALDDLNSLDYLSDLAAQYIEELYESDSNKMNMLIEHLI